MQNIDEEDFDYMPDSFLYKFGTTLIVMKDYYNAQMREHAETFEDRWERCKDIE